MRVLVVAPRLPLVGTPLLEASTFEALLRKQPDLLVLGTSRVDELEQDVAYLTPDVVVVYDYRHITDEAMVLQLHSPLRVIIVSFTGAPADWARSVRPIWIDANATGAVERLLTTISAGARSGVRGSGLRRTALAIDIGHSVLTGAVADSEGNILAQESERGIDVRDPAVLSTAADLAAQVLAAADVSVSELVGVGVAVPGPIDWQTGMIASPVILPEWQQLPKSLEQTMVDRLEKVLSRRLLVFVENDANLGVLGEVASGAWGGCRNLLFLFVDVGIGAGLILDGQLYRGSIGAAGELGHAPIAASQDKPEPPVCDTCGRSGCLEALASVPAILNQLQRIDPTKYADQSFVELLRLVLEEGDPEGKRAIIKAGHCFGSALAAIVNVLDPDAVVVGGLLSKAGDMFLDPIREELRRHSVRADPGDLKVVGARYGDFAPLHGAIALVLRGGLKVMERDLCPFRLEPVSARKRQRLL